MHMEVTKLIDYSPLWETMKQRSISQYDLINMGVDKHTMDSLRNNRSITMLTLEKLCILLDCGPDGIVAFPQPKD